MKATALTREALARPQDWPKGYKLPSFDILAMEKATAQAPTWLHIGAGNIFRIFIAGLQQDLLEAGYIDKGIVVYESYDEDIIPASFTPYDNLTLAVTLNADGSVDKEVIASVADAFGADLPKLTDVIVKPSLQLISFTITEKGYAANNICTTPTQAKTAMEQVTAGLYARFQAGSPPMALVAMDNFAENGTKVAEAVETIARAWQISDDFIKYAQSQSYPWTMIDKITPQPSKSVAEILEKDGFTSTQITQTPKNTTVASFVNAEKPQYLVIEDNFPNGRPPLEKSLGKGVYFTDRETVRKADQMKVCACLNPLHTVLGVCGVLLGYPTISACMQDKRLVAFINHAAEEAMPTVANPGIINPQEFLREVVTQRFPNPFIPDTPERINQDASQKIPVRFGETLKARAAVGLDIQNLEAIPRFIALWLRYRLAMNDTGNPMEPSPDPKLPESVKSMNAHDLHPILSDKNIFGVDLYDVGLGDKVTAIFAELIKPGAVNQLLTQWYGV
ncbi:MAG: mannitol dehydrogenase family protein [Defluviitaleaceae bacterium]|nr:mannitol dehydrogenase family protein [Defluviitaleaceae bacterium]